LLAAKNSKPWLRSRCRKPRTNHRRTAALAASNQQPATSNQQPATNNQQLLIEIRPMQTSQMLIETLIPLRWRDLDAYNHVNNSLFLTFLEEARIQWFESFPEPWRCQAYEPILAAATVNFRRPIQYPETLRVRLFCERIGRSSLTIAHRISAAGDDQILYADGNTVVVWIGPADGRPLPLPEVVRRVVGAND
jgi:acyl-CoA thioester hydrolase